MDWKRVSLGSGYELRFHSKTEVSTVSKNGTCVALIGRAFDLDDQERNADIIAQRILDRLASSPDSAIRYAAYLGGRFALFLLNDEKLMAVPDCHSTYAIHSSVSDSGVLFCSHWTLAANILNLPRADHVLESPHMGGFRSTAFPFSFFGRLSSIAVRARLFLAAATAASPHIRSARAGACTMIPRA